LNGYLSGSTAEVKLPEALSGGTEQAAVVTKILVPLWFFCENTVSQPAYASVEAHFPAQLFTGGRRSLLLVSDSACGEVS
jgi:hypothetical protein